MRSLDAIDPTPRQLEVLGYVAECIANGLPPSNSEIRRRFGFASSNSVASHLRLIRLKGLIERDSRARAIFITPLGRKWLRESRRAVAP